MQWIGCGAVSPIVIYRSLERNGMLISVWDCRGEKTHLEYFRTRTFERVLVSTGYEAVSVSRTLAKSGLRSSQRIPRKFQETYL